MHKLGQWINGNSLFKECQFFIWGYGIEHFGVCNFHFQEFAELEIQFNLYRQFDVLFTNYLRHSR